MLALLLEISSHGNSSRHFWKKGTHMHGDQKCLACYGYKNDADSDKPVETSTRKPFCGYYWSLASEYSCDFNFLCHSPAFVYLRQRVFGQRALTAKTCPSNSEEHLRIVHSFVMVSVWFDDGHSSGQVVWDERFHNGSRIWIYLYIWPAIRGT